MDLNFQKAIEEFDKLNALDPNKIKSKGEIYPKELLYSNRMTDTLLSYDSNPSEIMQLTVRCQHLCRWEIPRSTYEQNRTGYLKWRKDLSKFHVQKTSIILKDLEFEEDTINKVTDLLKKKGLKTNPEVQLLEDVVCLVFLEYYFEQFSNKYNDEKMIEILRKTWVKMSYKAQARALKLKFSARSENLIKQAISSKK